MLFKNSCLSDEEFFILSQEKEIPSWVQDFRIDCNISSVMNYYCKVTISTGMMPLHLIINNENCCVARLFIFCLIYSETFMPDYIQKKKSLFPVKLHNLLG